MFVNIRHQPRSDGDVESTLVTGGLHERFPASERGDRSGGVPSSIGSRGVPMARRELSAVKNIITVVDTTVRRVVKNADESPQ